jgi:hypothetical protein
MSSTLNFSPEKLFKLKKLLPKLPPAEKRRVLDLLKVYETQVTQELGKTSFLDWLKSSSRSLLARKNG